MYGIEGLKRSTESDEYDHWLSLFKVVRKELEKPSNNAQGNFPLKESVIPEPETREEIVQGFKELSERAQEIERLDIKSRQQESEKIEEHVQLAEELYDKLDDIEQVDKRVLA